MSCKIGRDARCDDKKKNAKGDYVSCKACKRVSLVGRDDDNKFDPNSRSGNVLYENKQIWYKAKIPILDTVDNPSINI